MDWLSWVGIAAVLGFILIGLFMAAFGCWQQQVRFATIGLAGMAILIAHPWIVAPIVPKLVVVVLTACLGFYYEGLLICVLIKVRRKRRLRQEEKQAARFREVNKHPILLDLVRFVEAGETVRPESISN